MSGPEAEQGTRAPEGAKADGHEASARGRTYLELPSEMLTASTPVEFRRLLDRIMNSAGLTASQVAIKTAIPRSQAYSMVSTNRTTLPSRPGQVREFVQACGLAPFQVSQVMDLWDKLDQLARDRATGRVNLSSAGTDAATGTAIPAEATRNVQISAYGGGAGVPRPPGGPRRPSAGSPGYYRPPIFTDLLFSVLDNEARTRRALRLLVPLALAVVAIVAILAAWAILQPEGAPAIEAILGGSVLLPITSGLRRAIRIRR
ncbi:MAG TPA: hypothetical protein VF070_41805 [Streptosporangiaceae bacterium]